MYLALVSHGMETSTTIMCTEDTETDFSASVDVGIEPAATAIGGQASHRWGLRGIFGADFDLELEETKLVGCVGRTDNKAAQITDILLKVGDGKG